MPISWAYMPILKWKRGEQDALRYLEEEQWVGVTPMLELQPIGVAADITSLRTALPAYLKVTADQIKKSIPSPEHAVAIDTGYVSSDYPKQIGLLLSICRTLNRVLDHPIIPVIRSAWIETLGTLSHPEDFC